MAEETKKRMSDEVIGWVGEAIRHWQRMQKNPFGHETPLGEFCSLCTWFAAVSAGRCADCPVYAVTEKRRCLDTPWAKAYHAWSDYRETLNTKYPEGVDDVERLREVWESWADEEIRFLIALLPEDKQEEYRQPAEE